MSTHDPKDGLTDAEYKWLNGPSISVKWRLWVMAMAKENATLKAERREILDQIRGMLLDAKTSRPAPTE